MSQTNQFSTAQRVQGEAIGLLSGGFFSKFLVALFDSVVIFTLLACVHRISHHWIFTQTCSLSCLLGVGESCCSFGGETLFRVLLLSLTLLFGSFLTVRFSKRGRLLRSAFATALCLVGLEFYLFLNGAHWLALIAVFIVCPLLMFWGYRLSFLFKSAD